MLFIDALAIYFRAWLSAFGPEGRRLAPLTLRRLLFLLVLFPMASLLLALHNGCLLIDRLLFPAFRQCRIQQPIFIVGVPRSGTTFLHRELARDASFVSSHVWEVLFAPAICQRRLIGFVAAVDAKLKSPLKSWLTHVFAGASADIQQVHPIGLDAAEEDYLLLLSAAGCFFASLAFPASQSLADLGRLSAAPPRRRERLLDHYHSLLQRQRYVAGERRILSKNAAFASWLPYLARRYPDAITILCIRDPHTALASQLSSLAGARRVLGSYPQPEPLERQFAAYYSHWYHCLRLHSEEAEQEALVVEQEWMREHSERLVAAIYERLERPASSEADSRGSLPPRHNHTASQALKDGFLTDDYARLQRIARIQWGSP